MHKRQWNDWRCYRCGRWQTAEDGVQRSIDSPIGTLTILICAECASERWTLLGAAKA